MGYQELIEDGRPFTFTWCKLPANKCRLMATFARGMCRCGCENEREERKRRSMMQIVFRVFESLQWPLLFGLNTGWYSWNAPKIVYERVFWSLKVGIVSGRDRKKSDLCEVSYFINLLLTPWLRRKSGHDPTARDLDPHVSCGDQVVSMCFGRL